MMRGAERLLVGTVAAVVVTGIAFELLARPSPNPTTAAVSGPRLVARTSYCPPAPSANSNSQIALGGPPEAGVAARVGRGPVHSLGAGNMLLRTVKGRAAVPVTGFGSSVEAGSMAAPKGPVPGAAAAGCATAPSSRWYFAEGSSALGHNQRLLVYNPFPDEAVVRVTLFTPKGPKERAGLADIPVHARSYTAIAINKAVRILPVLGARVNAVRGRVVAWRAMLADPRDRPDGVELSLGAPEPSKTWYLPDGAVGDGYSERVSILNPSQDDEAVVTVTLASDDGSVPVPRLVELPIPAGTVRAIELNKFNKALPPGLTGAGVIVKSLNDVAVVVERSVAYSTPTISGVASEVGSPVAAEAWLVPPAAAAAEYDAIALLNPGESQARVTIIFERPDGDPLRPAKLARVPLGPGRRIKLSITDYTQGRPLVAIVTSDNPVVAERFAYSSGQGDAAAVMGLPLRRIAP